MSELRDRLDGDLKIRSEAYRSLVPTDQRRLIEDAIGGFLHDHYDELREAILDRFAKLPAPPGKGDSWSW